MTFIIERGWLDVLEKHREGEITPSNQFLGMLKDICRARVRQIFTEKQIDEIKLIGDLPATLIQGTDCKKTKFTEINLEVPRIDSNTIMTQRPSKTLPEPSTPPSPLTPNNTAGHFSFQIKEHPLSQIILL